MYVKFYFHQTIICQVVVIDDVAEACFVFESIDLNHSNFSMREGHAGRANYSFTSLSEHHKSLCFNEKFKRTHLNRRIGKITLVINAQHCEEIPFLFW